MQGARGALALGVLAVLACMHTAAAQSTCVDGKTYEACIFLPNCVWFQDFCLDITAAVGETTTTAPPPPADNSNSSSELFSGKTILAIVAAGLGTLIFVLAVYLFIDCRRRHKSGLAPVWFCKRRRQAATPAAGEWDDEANIQPAIPPGSAGSTGASGGGGGRSAVLAAAATAAMSSTPATSDGDGSNSTPAAGAASSMAAQQPNADPLYQVVGEAESVVDSHVPLNDSAGNALDIFIYNSGFQAQSIKKPAVRPSAPPPTLPPPPPPPLASSHGSFASFQPPPLPDRPSRGSGLSDGSATSLPPPPPYYLTPHPGEMHPEYTQAQGASGNANELPAHVYAVVRGRRSATPPQHSYATIEETQRQREGLGGGEAQAAHTYNQATSVIKAPTPPPLSSLPPPSYPGPRTTRAVITVKPAESTEDEMAEAQAETVEVVEVRAAGEAVAPMAVAATETVRAEKPKSPSRRSPIGGGAVGSSATVGRRAQGFDEKDIHNNPFLDTTLIASGPSKFTVGYDYASVPQMRAMVQQRSEEVAPSAPAAAPADAAPAAEPVSALLSDADEPLPALPSAPPEFAGANTLRAIELLDMEPIHAAVPAVLANADMAAGAAVSPSAPPEFAGTRTLDAIRDAEMLEMVAMDNAGAEQGRVHVQPNHYVVLDKTMDDSEI